MASNAASRDDSGGRNRRRNLRESFAVRERETNDSHGLSLLKLEVAAAKCDVWRLKSTVGCLVTNFETLKQQVIEEQELVYELKVGGIEGIVGKVIHDLTIMGQNTMYKVAENIIPPMEENGEHDLLADICIDSQKQNFSFNPPITLDSCGKQQIWGKIPANEVDHLADKRETDYRNDKSDTVEEARHRKGNNIFPLIGKISGKDSKVLKYLFGKPRRGRHESREEVARSGEFGVSLGDIQCLWPTISISSKVINIWAAYLCQTNSNSWFLPTFFGEQALSDPSVVPVSVASTIVRCGLQRFHRRLKDCVQIFIPLHDKITKHWFLLVMKLKEKTAELLDSVPELTSLNRRIEIARATMLLLQTVFSNAMTKSSDMYYNFPSFCLSFPEGNPTTDIKYDSGIFVMMQMKCYSDKWFEGYNSEVMRSALALEIVNNQSNELLKSVIAAAMKGKGFEEGAYTQTTQANAVVTAEVVATECDVATGIIHEKPPNGWKCRSHRKRKFRV